MQLLGSSLQKWALLAAVFAALTAIFPKIGVSDFNTNFATLLRAIFAVLAFGALISNSRQHHPLSSLSERNILFLILSGLAPEASRFCYSKALQLGQAAKVLAADKMSVVFVAILGALFGGEKPSASPNGPESA